MRVEFRKALLPQELRSLVAFDRKVFPSDYFSSSQWQVYECYWLLVGNRRVGCCAMEEHADFSDDLADNRVSPRREGSLYIASTGILPKFRGKGLGQLSKAWQIAYARMNGFTRIVTNTRRRNTAMIALNKKFGFRVLRTSSCYYREPTDATVVMELLLDNT